MPEPLLTRYLQPLLAGRRAECFDIVAEAAAQGRPAGEIMIEVIWPAMNQLDRMFRDDRVDAATNNMACRINRTVVDQLQAHLPRRSSTGRRAVVCAGQDAREEIGAQMITDLFQAEGWEGFLLGGSIPHDEIVSLIGRLRPAVLVIYGSQPGEVPEIRNLVEMIREIGVCPTMNIMVSGGVFDRADGLWREIGADLYIPQGPEIVTAASTLDPREPGPAKPGIVKKRQRRRKDKVEFLSRPTLPATHEPVLA